MKKVGAALITNDYEKAFGNAFGVTVEEKKPIEVIKPQQEKETTPVNNKGEQLEDK